MTKGFLLAAVLAVFFGIASVPGAPAIAADSACKGLAKGKCEGASTCSWVNGYKTKEGKNVAAYCRTKGKGSSAKSKAKDAGKSASKKSDAAAKKAAAAKKSATSAAKPNTAKTN